MTGSTLLSATSKMFTSSCAGIRKREIVAVKGEDWLRLYGEAVLRRMTPLPGRSWRKYLF